MERVPISAAELESLADPAALLAHARALEPSLRLTERTATLDRLERLLAGADAPAPPPERDWALELAAERALDAARMVEIERALELASAVLAAAAPEHELASARALDARGRALAWTGTDGARRRADRVLAEVAERYRALGLIDLQGGTIYWRGQTIYYQNGDLPRARELIAQALELLAPDPGGRRASALTFYADALSGLGEWDAAAAACDESAELAAREDDDKARAYAAWSRARLASARGDALATDRHIRETERDAGDWFATHIGDTFLADAAEMLDRVGRTEDAHAYLDRALASAPQDEFVRQARALLLARSGDPLEALDALQSLAAGDWLEKRHVWRHTLFTAWATFRAGREPAGELAARALEQATVYAGLELPLAGERELVLALAPLAANAGSAIARTLLLDGRELYVRLFGAPLVLGADGRELELPAGKPGELVRLLALHEHGLPVEMVLDAFFPDAAPAAARQRLRQILTRLRASAGDIVVRSGDTLGLRPAWVDVRAFRAAADRVRTTRGAHAVQLAYAALALRPEPLLPLDRYAAWAQDARDQVEYRHLALLDLVAADAAARGAHQEALTALDAAADADPHDAERYAAIAEQLLALGRHGTAQYLAQRAGIERDAGP